MSLQKELNKQKEEYDDDNQNIDIQKTSSKVPVQIKKTAINQPILHPKSLNTNSQDVSFTAEELYRREQGLYCQLK